MLQTKRFSQDLIKMANKLNIFFTKLQGTICKTAYGYFQLSKVKNKLKSTQKQKHLFQTLFHYIKVNTKINIY